MNVPLIILLIRSMTGIVLATIFQQKHLKACLLYTSEGEYRVLTRRLNGQTIMLSADSHDYINPMDIELEENMDDVLRLKSCLLYTSRRLFQSLTYH